ncbi:MAG: MerR family transcriptional regulator [Acidimicrobiia bacterium]|nr:MerR family transcriptional regulator [Acidimicrobiia bacterium]
MDNTVGQVARLAGVTVRTLHHYDEIGLLHPSGRSEAGYRLYSEADLERLQELLFYRELGFGLDDIKRMMGDPGYDRGAALREHRELLQAELAARRAMLETVETAIARHEKGATMSKEEMFEVFGDFDPAEHEAEARERWGDTDAHKESSRRTSQYTKDDWVTIKAEADAIEERLAELLRSGADPSGGEAMAAAEAHRQHIDSWFYPCSSAMHVNLAEMYVADARFAEHYDSREPGLATFVRDAIKANAIR